MATCSWNKSPRCWTVFYPCCTSSFCLLPLLFLNPQKPAQLRVLFLLLLFTCKIGFHLCPVWQWSTLPSRKKSSACHSLFLLSWAAVSLSFPSFSMSLSISTLFFCESGLSKNPMLFFSLREKSPHLIFPSQSSSLCKLSWMAKTQWQDDPEQPHPPLYSLLQIPVKTRLS